MWSVPVMIDCWDVDAMGAQSMSMDPSDQASICLPVDETGLGNVKVSGQSKAK